MAILRSRQTGQEISVINGAFDSLGVIAFSSAAKNNTDTAAPFNNTGDALAGKALLLQADQDVYVLTTTATSVAVTSSTGIKLFAGERIIVWMDAAHPYISALRVSADGNLRVWELK